MTPPRYTRDLGGVVHVVLYEAQRLTLCEGDDPIGEPGPPVRLNRRGTLTSHLGPVTCLRCLMREEEEGDV